MKTIRKLDFSNACIYLALDCVGVALGFLFVAGAFFNEYTAVFLMSVLILAIAWVQSCISVRKYK